MPDKISSRESASSKKKSSMPSKKSGTTASGSTSTTRNAPEGLKGRAGGSSKHSKNLLKIDATNREVAAAEIYRDEILYHTTSVAGKGSIQNSGFNMRAKLGGATAELTNKVFMSNEFIENTQTHHYAFLDKGIAKEFQQNNLKESGEPALTRFFRGSAPLEFDPDYSNPAAVRWGTDIPSDHVLKSARTPATWDESTMMRAKLEERGIDVNEQEAGRLLREVQSDSEDDFTSGNGMAKSKWQIIREQNPNISRKDMQDMLNKKT